ncbi:hypothetical protein CSKR_101507 [Clonorchis sinensis]|uniref:Protein cramped-like n=1 Tax=Clonorchis sinensis TaxID=79923 RepID=A0A8T1MBZ7_CLOSI|nr:hypothetical protein CSKR_101507 [Clonorchis sinensis]
MKTRSALSEAPNIAAIVKARHHARVMSPTNESLQCTANSCSGDPSDQSYMPSATSSLTNSAPVTGQVGSEDAKFTSDDKVKTRSDGTRGTWNPDDRRLFFQAVRLYGRNFTEITKFIRSRGHRTTTDATNVTSNTAMDCNPTTGGSGPSASSQTVFPGFSSTSATTNAPGQSGSASSGSSANPTAAHCGGQSDLNDPCGGRTREQVRFFYQQTWHKVRRYIKFSEAVPQHVREVYAIVNYSVIRTRIKKPLDHRLGERLNELVHCGTTIIRHNGRRFMLRTPVCPALKEINHISAPTYEFLLPEDVWIELVPASQVDLWRVLEAEQNPRLRLRVDINRQLSDLIQLVETKWQLATERMKALLGLPAAHNCPMPRLLIRTSPSQTIDGAIRLHEVARIRSGDIALRSYLERRNTTDTNAAGPMTSNLNAAVPLSTESNYTSELSVGSSDSVRGANEGADYNDCPSSVAVTSPLPSASVPGSGGGSSGAAQQSSSSAAASELDLRETGRQLSQGVSFEAARGIKVLTLFLALGCPERIRFEYLFTTEKSACPKSNPGASCHSGFLYYQPADPEGHGIGNGLRRLLHLNASDYLLHRDWLQSSPHMLKKPTLVPQPPAPANSTPGSCAPLIPNNTPIDASPAATAAVNVMQPPITPVRVTTLPHVPPTTLPISASSQAMTDSPILSRTQGVPRAASPAVVVPKVTTTGASHLAVLQTPPAVASVQMPNLVIYTKPAGTKAPITAVERQLDHQRTPDAPRTCPISTTPSAKMPIPRLTPLAPRSDATPTSTPRKSPVTIVPRHTITSSPVTSASKQSSLNAMKAYNTRRRTSTLGRGSHSSHKSGRSSNIFPLSLPSLTPSTPTLTTVPSSKPAIPVSQSTENEFKTAVPGVASTAISASGSTFLPGVTFTAAAVTTPLGTSLNPNCSFVSLDGDLSLGPLLEHNGTNQSSMSAFSNDTLVSLLNTIYHPSSTTDFVAPQELRTDSGSLPGLSTVTILADAVPVEKTEEFNQANNRSLNEITSYKREETGETTGDSNWNDFQYLHKYCPSASTPHIPSESPAFGDISLTDSMAAAVMDTHHGELDTQDLDPNLLEQSYNHETPAEFGDARVPHHVLPTPTEPRTTQPTGYVSDSEVFLRMLVPPNATTHADQSGTVDLNSLLQSVVSSSTQPPVYECTQTKFALHRQ